MKPENTYVDTGEKIIINPYNECEFLYVFNKEDSSMTTHRCGNDKNNTFFNELKEFYKNKENNINNEANNISSLLGKIKENPINVSEEEINNIFSFDNKNQLKKDIEFLMDNMIGVKYIGSDIGNCG